MDSINILSRIAYLFFLMFFTSHLNYINGQVRKNSLSIVSDTLRCNAKESSAEQIKCNEGNSIFFVGDVDKAPQFEGGEQGLYSFILKNLKYPIICRHPEPQGRVLIRFIINKNGEVCFPEIIKGIDPYLDAEAIRLVNAMPKWKPARLDGNSVSCYFILPILFRIQ